MASWRAVFEARRHLLDRIAEVADDRAAQTMSELFDEDREDPRILVRFDQIDAKLSEHGRRFDQIDERFDQVLETLDVKLDAMRFETLAAFRGEIQTTINGQWRTVLIGMTTLALLLVATSLALGQIL